MHAENTMSQTNKPDFSSVTGGAKPDFGNVQGRVQSTEAPAGGQGGGGSLGEQTYTVARGDTLSQIAKRFYGKPHWQPIFNANRDQLDDPDTIQPGQVLKIPAA